VNSFRDLEYCIGRDGSAPRGFLCLDRPDVGPNGDMIITVCESTSDLCTRTGG